MDRILADRGIARRGARVAIVAFALASALASALVSAPGPVSSPAAPRDVPWPDPRRLEAEVRAFERADSTSPPPRGAIVAVGSSSIRLWHDRIREDLAPSSVVPRGFGGSTMRDVLYYLDRLVIRHRPNAVLLYEGDNDIQEGVPAEEVRAVFDTLTTRVFAAKSNTRIYVISIKPSPARWARWPEMERANRLLRDACAAEPRLMYVDVATPMLDARTGRPRPELFGPDSLHMSPAGYDLWREVVRKPIEAARLRAGEQVRELLMRDPRWMRPEPVDAPLDVAPPRPLLSPPPARDSTRASSRRARPLPSRTRGPSARTRRRTRPRV